MLEALGDFSFFFFLGGEGGCSCFLLFFFFVVMFFPPVLCPEGWLDGENCSKYSAAPAYSKLRSV